ncbi:MULTISPECIES: helix-turn-helix domain-containing protein [unclassified Variovorax]|uniref:winged helix-turn-helix transcriptional regulator n=1 Tax=unclassified Variovorax TaxID=663243 RepID=UPI0008BFDD0A|nr:MULTISPECIES: helix-turn-helix domain-containing protein [unclassified Variovorax]SEK16600.1 transcriptional regulator, HxlR family [Variovorax sp. OK202]SFE53741.1 transcriptional regulator, HxlR family [Variovorax sp. OK212]
MVPAKTENTNTKNAQGAFVHGRPYTKTPSGPLFTPCAPHSVLARLGDKWTILVISHLAVAPGHRLRFTVLKAGIEGITQRMLTLTLRNLERDGLLRRYQYPEVPARVEYELTDMGASMLPALEGFTLWIHENWRRIEGNRRDYDEAALEG